LNKNINYKLTKWDYYVNSKFAYFMNKEDLKKTIISQSKFTQVRNYVRREKEKFLQEAFSDPFIIIISGIRRSGKSTLLNVIRKQNNEKNYYLNFDDNRLIDFKANDFEMLNEAFLELFGEEQTYYFDEIQNIASWEIFVRRLHNEGKKVFITGSNATMLSKELGTRLTGRNIQVELFPFSFREFLFMKGGGFPNKELYDNVIIAKIRNLFTEYLQKGGFAEYLQTPKAYFFTNLFDNIVYRDIISRYNLSNEKTIRELVLFLISNISKEMSYQSIRKFLNLSSPITVKNYLHYLENAYLFFTINKFDYSLKKQIINPKKVYCIDTGLANSVSFRFSENFGRQLENLVFLELKRAGYEIYYHRNKHECDFILKQRKRIVGAIQVCRSLNDEKLKQREMNGLFEAMDQYSLSNGIILTEENHDELEYKGKKISILPIWRWILKKNN
jgi:predicted AAA+ superfamily ATPase